MPRKVKILQVATNRSVTRHIAHLGRLAGLNHNRMSYAINCYVNIHQNLKANALATLTLPPRRLQRATSTQILPMNNDERVGLPSRRMSMSELQRINRSPSNIYEPEPKPNDNIEPVLNPTPSKEKDNLKTSQKEQAIVMEDRSSNYVDIPEPMDVDDEDNALNAIEKSIAFINELSINPEPMDIDEEEINTSPIAQDECIHSDTAVSSSIESASQCSENTKDDNIEEVSSILASKQVVKKIAPARPISCPPVLSVDELEPNREEKNSTASKWKTVSLENEINKENCPNNVQKSFKPFKIRGRRPSLNRYFKMDTIPE